jgi:hypothetical protein
VQIRVTAFSRNPTMSLLPTFGDHHEQMWQEMATAMGGDFINEEGWSKDEVRIKDGPWTVYLDIVSHCGYRSEAKYTRIRAPFVNKDGFRFNIHQRGHFEAVLQAIGIDKFLGSAIEIGIEEIDKRLVVHANDEVKIRKLLASHRIRALAQGRLEMNLQVKPNDGDFGPEFPDGVDELYLEVEDVVTDVDMLKGLFVLFAEILHHLCHIDSAYEDDPHLEL